MEVAALSLAWRHSQVGGCWEQYRNPGRGPKLRVSVWMGGEWFEDQRSTEMFLGLGNTK